MPRSFLVSWAVVALGLVADSPLTATDFTITIFNDNSSTNGDCSLREAIRAAESDAPVDGCPAGSGDDVITLPVGTVTFNDDQELVLGGSGRLTIQGSTETPSDSQVSCAFSNRFLELSQVDVVLRDFTITLCDSDGDWGGAIRAHTRSSLTLKNMSLALNQGGGRGGALYFDTLGDSGGRSLRIEDSEIGLTGLDGGTFDTPPDGSGVYALLGADDEMIVKRTLFSGNTLTSTTGPGTGGGLWISANSNAKVDLRDLELVNNRCPATDSVNHKGCGLAFGLRDTATAVVADLMVTGNYANATDDSTRTAGIHVIAFDESSLVAERLLLDGNLNGASTSSNDYQLTVETRNSAVALVRDVLAVNGQTGIRAVASSASTSTVRLDHLTATDNQTGVSVFVGASASLHLQNSIAWGNSWSDVTSSGSVTQASNHVGGADPLFVLAALGDYRLTSSSPDRDGGESSLEGVGILDLDHAPRVVGSETDRGAYEYDGLFGDDFGSGDTSAWTSAAP